MAEPRLPRQGRSLVLLAALFLPAGAEARPALSLRLAYAPALGELADAVPMSDAMSSQLPIQLDVLWRFGPLSAGAYASWGLGQVSAASCGAGADCSASAIRLGVEGLYAFPPVGRAGLVPWGGAGVGWEWASRRRERLGSETRYAWNGMELLLQGGADWPIGGRFAVGPFALLALGRYANVSLDTPAASGSAEIGAKAVHAWIHVGVRGRVDL